MRTALSASLDGEYSDLPTVDLEAHLAGCAECREWREAAHSVTRGFRVQGVSDSQPPPVDVRAAVLATAPSRRPSTDSVARWALFAVAVAQVTITGRLLFAGNIDSFRDLGSLDVALGIGFVAAAVRPLRAAGMRPIVGAAAILLTASAAVDLARHRTTVWDEAPHLLVLAGWLLISLLASRTPTGHSTPTSGQDSILDQVRSHLERSGRGPTVAFRDGGGPHLSQTMAADPMRDFLGFRYRHPGPSRDDDQAVGA